jgi:hypothetical protein
LRKSIELNPPAGALKAPELEPFPNVHAAKIKSEEAPKIRRTERIVSPSRSLENDRYIPRRR